MMLGIVFPSHPLNPRQVDPAYAEEHAAFQAAGHPVTQISVEALEAGSACALVGSARSMEVERWLYRGWMLSETAYARLASALPNPLVTSPADYLASHHLPGWYPHLADLTMFSAWTHESQVSTLWQTWQSQGHGPAFVKDYVKSNRTARGSCAVTEAELFAILQDLKTHRGAIEGGVVLREWVDLVPDSEQRLFVWQGRVHASQGEVSPQWSRLASAVALRHRAPFFSLDVALTRAGQALVIEVGDGQVSEPKGWPLDAFVGLWATA